MCLQRAYKIYTYKCRLKRVNKTKIISSYLISLASPRNVYSFSFGERFPSAFVARQTAKKERKKECNKREKEKSHYFLR